MRAGTTPMHRAPAVARPLRARLAARVAATPACGGPWRPVRGPVRAAAGPVASSAPWDARGSGGGADGAARGGDGSADGSGGPAWGPADYGSAWDAAPGSPWPANPDWGEAQVPGDWGQPDAVRGGGGVQQPPRPEPRAAGGFAADGGGFAEGRGTNGAAAPAGQAAYGDAFYGQQAQQQPGAWPFADTASPAPEDRAAQQPPHEVAPSDITLIGRRDADAMLPLSPSNDQARYYQPRTLSERVIQVLGSFGVSVVLSKSAVLAGPALLYPVWGPWIRAGLRNMQLYLRQFQCVGLWRAEVLGVARHTVPYAYRAADAAGDTLTVTLGDPWPGGARTELTFPYQPGCEDIVEGEPAELLVLGADERLSSFKVVRELYLPQSGMWLAEYPFLDRDAFLDVSLAIERGRQAGGGGGPGGWVELGARHGAGSAPPPAYAPPAGSAYDSGAAAAAWGAPAGGGYGGGYGAAEWVVPGGAAAGSAASGSSGAGAAAAAPAGAAASSALYNNGDAAPSSSNGGGGGGGGASSSGVGAGAGAFLADPVVSAASGLVGELSGVASQVTGAASSVASDVASGVAAGVAAGLGWLGSGSAAAAGGGDGGSDAAIMPDVIIDSAGAWLPGGGYAGYPYGGGGYAPGPYGAGGWPAGPAPPGGGGGQFGAPFADTGFTGMYTRDAAGAGAGRYAGAYAPPGAWPGPAFGGGGGAAGWGGYAPPAAAAAGYQQQQQWPQPEQWPEQWPQQQPQQQQQQQQPEQQQQPTQWPPVVDGGAWTAAGGAAGAGSGSGLASRHSARIDEAQTRAVDRACACFPLAPAAPPAPAQRDHRSIMAPGRAAGGALGRLLAIAGALLLAAAPRRAGGVAFDPCAAITPIRRTEPFRVGLVFWPGGLDSDWGALQPCDPAVQANLTAAGAMFASYNVRADRLTVLKTSFPEELMLTGRAPAGAAKVISVVAFRNNVRSDVRYIASFDPGVTFGTGFVSSLALLAKFELGSLRYLQFFNLTCNDCGGRTSARCINSTSCAQDYSECTCVTRTGGVSAGAGGGGTNGTGSGSVTNGSDAAGNSSAPGARRLLQDPAPDGGNATDAGNSSTNTTDNATETPQLGVGEVPGAAACNYANFSYCATGINLAFEGVDASSAAFSTGAQIRKLNSFSLVALYFTAKQKFFQVTDLFESKAGEYWGNFGAVQGDIQAAYSGNAEAYTDSVSSGLG
ncbi:hypothetical protein HT031_006289 [Scenedesmus sp. PABB004]|nr:hypothetical protein HT031_006289 [Scenedesmus sp. PABB004]